MITVVQPGAWTTVQDLGRPGYAHLGISACGAADPFSLRIGNRLLGNPDGAAALELTLVGGVFRFGAPAWIALSGSDFGATVEPPSGSPQALAPWSPRQVAAGTQLRVGSTRAGARAYLCVAGGIATRAVLGSRATHAPSGVGGAALRAGQVLPIGAPAERSLLRLQVDAEEIARVLARASLRFTPGPQADEFSAEARATFTSVLWEVSESADRSGLRLSGPVLAPPSDRDGRVEGVSAGSVQVPGSGQPIILFRDQQTTGGYPKLATIITADLSAVGQLRPRRVVRFEEVGYEQARAALLEQERLLGAVVGPS